MHSLLFSGLNVAISGACTILCVLIAWIVTRSVYRAYFHPLARVPGPRLGAVTSLWYAYHVRNGHMGTLGKTLHKKYGRVVRVRPNEVCFDSEEAFRLIYSMFSSHQRVWICLTRELDPVSGFEKSEFYSK